MWGVRTLWNFKRTQKIFFKLLHTPQRFARFVHMYVCSMYVCYQCILLYNMHIIIRYECEKILFSDTCDFDRLPHIWNQKYNDYLNIKPDSDRNGILQDIHWSGAAFGYFPSYTFGNLYAAQLYETLKKQIPNF